VHNWDDAYIKKDRAPLEKCWRRLLGIDEEGSDFKADEITSSKRAIRDHFRRTTSNRPKFVSTARTAIVTTHAKVKPNVQRRDERRPWPRHEVWVNQGGEWKSPLWHAIKIEKD